LGLSGSRNGHSCEQNADYSQEETETPLHGSLLTCPLQEVILGGLNRNQGKEQNPGWTKPDLQHKILLSLVIFELLIVISLMAPTLGTAR
jgi:hypothetical protein